MKILQKLRTNMAANLVGGILLSLVVLGALVSLFGSMTFTNAIRKEYAVTTFHMADTAATLVNGDHIDRYLAGENMEEYLQSKRYLDGYCRRMSVSLVYVIKVDTSDYGRFLSVFNCVNNEVDNSNYTEWEIGYKRNTTNDEYRQKYKALYAGEVPYETVYRMKPDDGSHPHITTLVPVKDSAGEVTAILCIQRPISEITKTTFPYVVTIVIATFILAVTAAYFIYTFIAKQFVLPVRKVSEEAARFAKENQKGEPLGKISSYDVIQNLANSIDKMETDLVNYVEYLVAVTADKERIGTELSFARAIQSDSIPSEFPAFPERKEFDIYASMTPAKEVGGDFYNFYLIDDDHLFLVIGDVSGKGIPASLFMMVSNIVTTERARMGGSPSEILSFVNDSLCENNKSDMFVTLWLGILEISTGMIIASNSGHEDAAVYHRGGSFELFKTRHGLPAGAFPNSAYQDFSIPLGKGDKVFIYTDGVPEASDKDDRMFTLDRMLDTLNACREGTPQEILESVRNGINAFAGTAPQFDDVTMLCIEYKGVSDSEA